MKVFLPVLSRFSTMHHNFKLPQWARGKNAYATNGAIYLQAHFPWHSSTFSLELRGQMTLLKSEYILSHPAPSDYSAVAVTLMFPSGSSSTPNPPQRCTTVVIANDRTPEDQDDYFNLFASSSDPSVFFTPGRSNVSVLIQDDDSKLYTYPLQVRR